MLSNDKPKYINVDPAFKPLPQYGHLSAKTAQYAAAEPQLRALHNQLWSFDSWTAARAAAGDAADVDALLPPGAPDRQRDIVTEHLEFLARDGYKVGLKVYKSRDVKPNATLVYRMHGGGWTLGRHEVDGAENVYAAGLAFVVVSVDYRKAPEHPFPTPLYDSYDGLVWCQEHAQTLGINSEKIIIAGGSAGANLAAALTIEAKKQGLTGIIAQILHFPALCHPKLFPRDQYEYGSWLQNKDDCVLGLLRGETFWDNYVPNAQPDARHSPLLASSLERLPPTLIQLAGCDIFRDEAFAYAQALKKAGVEVETHCYQGMPHWFHCTFFDAPETAVFFDRFTAFLKRL